MQYPLTTEYIQAIRDAADNLDRLAHLTPVLDSYGEPYRSSGAFAVVFKMKDEATGKFYALKCFTEEQEGRAEAYKMIAEELENIGSQYLTGVQYLDKELFVDSQCTDETEFPVLLMDWVDGVTMDAYIAGNYTDNYAMSMLCYQFCRMASWLRSQPIAHGDIKPDNIMVRADGSLVLVDYDGMFVPAMKGRKSPTIGTRDFSHPLRTADDFDETIDDFSLASIALSLKAIALKPTLLDEYGAPDRLLFSASDYSNPAASCVFSAMKELFANTELQKLYSLFLMSLSCKSLAMVSFRAFAVAKPKQTFEPHTIYYEATEKIKSKWIDKNSISHEFANGKGKIRLNDYVTEIEEYAFSHCSRLTSINIPDSVTEIGNSAFRECSRLTSVTIGNFVTSIGNFTFNNCSELTIINIPDTVTEIGGGAFEGCSGLTSVSIGNSVTSIGNRAFSDCSGLMSIDIPNSVTSIGDYAFGNCRGLTAVTIPNSVREIGNGAFHACRSLSSITIPQSVTSIGWDAFRGCSGLISVTIPESVKSIGEGAFLECIKLPNDIKEKILAISKVAFQEKEWW